MGSIQDGAGRVGLIVATTLHSALRKLPSGAPSDLVDMLKLCPASSDCVLVVALSEIQCSAFHSLAVHHGGIGATSRPAREVVSVIASTSKRVLQTIGDGYSVVTRVVGGGLPRSGHEVEETEDGATQPPVYSVMAFCGLDGVLDSTLDLLQERSSVAQRSS